MNAYQRLSKCALCKENEVNVYEDFICQECRDIFKYYKDRYKLKKLLAETTNFDETIFEQIWDRLKIKEVIEEDKNGLFPSSVDEMIEDIKETLNEVLNRDTWFAKQPGRYENFLKYVEKRIREEYQ